MARTKISTLSLLLSISLVNLLLTPQSSAGAAVDPASNFIRTSCRATTYPAVCLPSLSNHASDINKNPTKLITTALTVSIDRAQSTKTFVANLNKFRGLKPRERAALKDCLEQISDGVDRLSRSVGELKKMGSSRGPEFTWHMSNLQTWVSAALTDDNTCMDGFAGRALNGRIKSSIRAKMTGLAQVTSNALALCNKFGGKY